MHAFLFLIILLLASRILLNLNFLAMSDADKVNHCDKSRDFVMNERWIVPARILCRAALIVWAAILIYRS